MGVIREELTLVDGFSASFRMFNDLGQQALSKLTDIGKSNNDFAQSASYAAQQLESMRASLDAQQILYTAQNQKLQKQKDLVSQLSQNYSDLVSAKGADASETIRANEALGRAMLSEQRIFQQALRTSQAISKQSAEIQEFTQKMGQAETATQKTTQAQQEHKNAIDQSVQSANRLVIFLRNAAVSLGAVSLAKSFLTTADAMAQIDSKINMINDGMQSTEELQQMIYESAQRARASYTDTANLIVRIGQNAGEAFGNNAELIQFAENLNKSFVIAGATQEEISSATLQLSQAMAAGVLRGEELNAVFESAPNVIQRIAEYMGKSTGEIREMAAEGQITADIVKNALLQATGDINEQFKEMPMTLGQAFTKGKNYIQQSLKESFGDWTEFINSENGQKLINGITVAFAALANTAAGAADIAIWAADGIVEHWDIVGPLLAGAASAVMLYGAVSVAAGLKSALAWAAAAWPFLLIAVLIGVCIIAIEKLGGGFQRSGATAGAAWGLIASVAYNGIANIWDWIATFVEFFVNVWNDPINTVNRHFVNLADNILSLFESVTGLIDAMLGTDMSKAYSQLRDDLAAAAQEKYGEPAFKLERMEKKDIRQSVFDGMQTGRNFGQKIDNVFGIFENLPESLENLGNEFDGMQDGIEVKDVGTVGTVKNVQGDVSLSDEDIQLYRDLAERRYMNNVELQTLAPNIAVSIPESAAGSLRAQDVADEINAILIEQMASHTAVSHG